MTPPYVLVTAFRVVTRVDKRCQEPFFLKKQLLAVQSATTQLVCRDRSHIVEMIVADTVQRDWYTGVTDDRSNPPGEMVQ